MLLSERLMSLPSFRRQYEALLRLSAGDQIPGLKWEVKREDLLSQIDWDNILSIASVLSFSDSSKCQAAALRITQTCLLEKSCSSHLKSACGFILENLTNQQALNLAINKNFLSKEYVQNLSSPTQMFRISNLIRNSILVGKKFLPVNQFQKQVYDSFKITPSLSISAPTSSGKSFILGQLLLDSLLQKGYKCIVYVVPSRALIDQVEKDLRDLIQANQKYVGTVNISSIPPRNAVNRDQKNIFVFTQERLHWFLNGDYYVPVDLLVVDEAQKIGDRGRGVLLQQVIEKAYNLNPEVSFLFASPFTKNPEVFFQECDIEPAKYRVIDKDFVSVNQNLIYLNQRYRRPREFKAYLITEREQYLLGCLTLTTNQDNDQKKVACLAQMLTCESDCSLIYANTPSDCEKLALGLAEHLPEIKNQKLEELAKLVKKVIHPKYRLVQTIKKGVAFHYGNLPLIVRTEIEKLFSLGILRYLVCTSTLLEGVNSPAKNLFLSKPKKGRKLPLSNTDFWNLAGRAGRAGKEFAGNIYCINPSDWSTKFTIKPERQKIQNSLVKVGNDDSFLDWLDRSDFKLNTEEATVFGYYFLRFLKNKKTDEIKNSSVQRKLIEVITEQSRRLKLPVDILEKNFAIPPLKQQALFDTFKQYTEEGSNKLIPVDPRDSNAFPKYVEITSTISRAFSLGLTEKQIKRLVTLALYWMRGDRLSEIIDRTLNREENLEEAKESKIIRETMQAIEQDIRFEFLGYMTCYVELLRYYFSVVNNLKASDSVPDVGLWLELGVSDPKLISLMELGLSRSTCLEILDSLKGNSKSKEECLEQLKKVRESIGKLNLPDAMNREIEEIMSQEID